MNHVWYLSYNFYISSTKELRRAGTFFRAPQTPREGLNTVDDRKLQNIRSYLRALSNILADIETCSGQDDQKFKIIYTRNLLQLGCLQRPIIACIHLCFQTSQLDNSEVYVQWRIQKGFTRPPPHPQFLNILWKWNNLVSETKLFRFHWIFKKNERKYAKRTPTKLYIWTPSRNPRSATDVLW